MTITPCQVTIPGVGLCELHDHPLDGVGRQVHQKGYVTWNGAEERFFIESAQNRWHSHLDCPALRAQEAVRLLMTKTRPSIRPCTLCVAPVPLQEALAGSLANG